MHTIQDIRAEYDRLDRIVGIDSSDVEIAVSPYRGRRLGSFICPTAEVPPLFAKPLRILISAAVMETEDEEVFLDTIRHEYAHMAVYKLDGGKRHGHDGVWKAMCRRVGCTPKAGAEATEERKQAWRESANYMVRCKGCGNEIYYQRAGKVVKTLSSRKRHNYRCGRCGSKDLELYVRG